MRAMQVAWTNQVKPSGLSWEVFIKSVVTAVEAIQDQPITCLYLQPLFKVTEPQIHR
jgi:hypothetical protein